MGSLLTMHRSALAAAGPDAAARELALVERARRGDMDAWSRLYQEHYDRLFKHVAYLAGDVHEAEDLVQETFARALVGLGQFESRASVVGWLRGIALNVVRKHWRARYRGDRAMTRLATMTRDAVSGPATDPEGVHLRERRAAVLLAALETLPPRLREAFVLCDMQGVAVHEAAAELGVTPGNLRVRATRARARIRGELVRLGWLTNDGTTRGEDDHEAR